MNEGQYAILVFVLIGLAIFLSLAAIFAVVSVLFLRKAVSTYRKIEQEPAQSAEDFLKSAQLRPWTPDAWADLSGRWEGWWRNWSSPFRQEGKVRGVVKSLREPEGPGWISFTVERQQLRSGVVVLRTSERRVELKIQANSRLDPNVRGEAWLDGAPAGSISVDFPTCVFRGTDGTTEARWTWDFRWNNEVRVLNRVVSRDLYYDPVDLDGRTIAALIDTWIRYPHPESDVPIPPALRSVEAGLDDAEQGVLLIVLAMSLYYDSLRWQLRGKIDVIYDW